MNQLESEARYVAMASVGSIENSVYDGQSTAEEAAQWTRDEMLELVRGDVMAECPREVRFLGSEALDRIVSEAVDTFEFKSWS